MKRDDFGGYVDDASPSVESTTTRGIEGGDEVKEPHDESESESDDEDEDELESDDDVKSGKVK